MEQELDVYLFHRGEHREVYNYMGAHLTKKFSYIQSMGSSC
mgnify:CR=1 FL=1